MTTKLPLRSYYYLFGARLKDLNKNPVIRIDLLLRHVRFVPNEQSMTAIFVHQIQTRPQTYEPTQKLERNTLQNPAASSSP
jgi:hypothetical protein